MKKIKLLQRISTYIKYAFNRDFHNISNINEVILDALHHDLWFHTDIETLFTNTEIMFFNISRLRRLNTI